eukprot:CAMPEP_0202446800 /NCGR_PEP_ID=MMETSP1360-20130828/5380_1 /ASSEMBLY_ACC=CAM_ASM_000848 /TAXON_ID=515479 /ORGANISM="Licmophora paradoxa, Strain CCMP2313" /LENGTH=435 /DNA_ID=CAMNT_0049063503 /DNA_START=55 /DNA_END=1362 /DNA_ORIENTATION=+
MTSETRKRSVPDVLGALNASSEGPKSILVRVDFNVPMDNNGVITNDSRIRGALPTINAILEAKHNAILISHMGRPKLVQKGLDTEETHEQRKKLSLSPVAQRLETLLGKGSVIFGKDCIGDDAKTAVQALPKDGGGVVLLENLRFYTGEEKNDSSFAQSLASLADAYINDAFGTCHRAHASVTGVPALMQPELCGVGCLVASEISYLDFSSLGPDELVAAIIGGSKVSTKLPVIKGLLEQVDTLILGGGLAFTFLKAQGITIGNSLVEDSMIDTAKQLIEEAKSKNKNIVLPIDAVCAKEFPKEPSTTMEGTATFDLVPGQGIEDGWMGLDVGPKTVELLEGSLKGIKKIVFNGPMGVFEIPPFDIGTRGLVDTIVKFTEEGGISVVGGGDSVAALEAFDKTDDVSYVSTGGGATLELLAGDVLPGVEAIGEVKA